MVLDESGSVSSSNFKLMKTLCADLVSDFGDEDRVSVFTFNSSVKKRLGLIDKETAISTIKSLSQRNGNTAIYDAIDMATDEFMDNSYENATKIMIVLTDGYDNSSDVTSSYVTENAAKNNIIIYTVGVGSVSLNILTKIASETGGCYYSASNFSQLEKIFDRIVEDADIYKDSDSDGISDYHEKKIALGELKCGNGVEVKHFEAMNYLDSDSDDDGISDGDELYIESKIVDGENIYYCHMTSNPCMNDSDGDELCDAAECYIGTNAFSTVNEIITLNAPGPLEKNTYAEWLELIESHAWNYIHNAVQEHIEIKSNKEIVKEYPVPVGRVDLYRDSSKEMWEVKPSSYANSPKRELALEQLSNYVNCSEEYKIGGGEISNDKFVLGDEYTVSYYNMWNGLIIYYFQKDKVEEPVYIVVTQPEEETESDILFQPVVAGWLEQWWGVVVGISIIGTTLAEDVLTLGTGVINDGAAIAFALALIVD